MVYLFKVWNFLLQKIPVSYLKNGFLHDVGNIHIYQKNISMHAANMLTYIEHSFFKKKYS